MLLSMLIFGLGPLTVYIKESTEEKGLACLSGAKSMAHYRVRCNNIFLTLETNCQNAGLGRNGLI